jgi:hypothetical protein
LPSGRGKWFMNDQTSPVTGLGSPGRKTIQGVDG